MKKALESTKKVFGDLNKLKTRVQELVYKEKYVILWNHIRQHHPNITEQEIINGLIYGLYKLDNNVDGRFISWSKFASPVRLIRIVFEIHETPDNEFVLVITAFEEE
jgi:predicted metalloenzyme YecM